MSASSHVAGGNGSNTFSQSFEMCQQQVSRGERKENDDDRRHNLLGGRKWKTKVSVGFVAASYVQSKTGFASLSLGQLSSSFERVPTSGAFALPSGSAERARSAGPPWCPIKGPKLLWMLARAACKRCAIACAHPATIENFPLSSSSSMGLKLCL